MRFWKALGRLFGFFGWLLVIAGILATAAPMIENDQVQMTLASFSEQTGNTLLDIANKAAVYCLANHYLVFGVGVALVLLALLIRRLADRPYYDDFDEPEPEPRVKPDLDILPRPAYDPGGWAARTAEEPSGRSAGQKMPGPTAETPANASGDDITAYTPSGTEAAGEAAQDGLPSSPSAGSGGGSLRDAYFSLLQYNNPQKTPPFGHNPEPSAEQAEIRAVKDAGGEQLRNEPEQPQLPSEDLPQSKQDWDIPLTGGWADMAGELPPIDMSPWDSTDQTDDAPEPDEDEAPAPFIPYGGASMQDEAEPMPANEPLTVTRDYGTVPNTAYTPVQKEPIGWISPAIETPAAIRRGNTEQSAEETAVTAKAALWQPEEEPISSRVEFARQQTAEVDEQSPEEPPVVVRRTPDDAQIWSEPAQPYEEEYAANTEEPETPTLPQTARSRRADPGRETVAAARAPEAGPPQQKPTYTVSVVGKTRIVTTIPNLRFAGEITPPTMLKGGLSAPKALSSFQNADHP
ncbi:MAG: hypothetical protein PHY64_06270, partial [Eubacteriales bacterium]|nr:hypothetical protein [Eubacteriales bacterium]